jgi:Ala-tRNA(Pro) deacylase
MKVATRVAELLAKHRVPFETIQHPEAFTSQEIAQAEHVSGNRLAKPVIAVADERFVMAVLPASRKLSLHKLGTVVGAKRVRLAEEEEFRGLFPDCEVGAMPPFGRLYGMPVLVDVDLTREKSIVFNAGSHQESVKMRYEDFERLARPDIADLGAAS